MSSKPASAQDRGWESPVQPPEVILKPPMRAGREHPSGYIPDDGLKAAINVAKVLRKPLIVTGEPGTGKTQLAGYLSWSLGHRDRNGEPRSPLIFEAKSSSTAKDLFYIYNTLGRFHAAQTNEGSQNSVDYITYSALGVAILNANEREVYQKWHPPDFEHIGPCQSVVLIDEVDKAPRDFPNDILNEVETMYFKVPEFGNVKFSAPLEMHPVLVITSNSEKNLPGPFLRRCIYYNIPFPHPGRLRQIASSRIRELADAEGPFVGDAIEFLLTLRDTSAAMQKKPATAELLDWLLYLVALGGRTDTSLRNQPDLFLDSLSALTKGAADQESAAATAKEWLAGGTPK
jgi:MoxR-like ATPase